MKKGIILEDVSFSYSKYVPVLRNINLEIKKGTFLGLAGTNGCGKSTLTLLLNGLIPRLIEGTLEGNVSVDGISTYEKNVAYFAQKVGYLFQNPDFSLFNLTVKEEIGFGLKNYKVKNPGQRIEKALEIVGLSQFADRDPQELSLGEKQKVALACVLALDTDYLILDEPIAQLDYKSSVDLYEILKKLNNQGKTIIVVEHDNDFLWNYSKEVVLLSKGEIVKSGKTKEILKDKILLKKTGLKIPSYKKL